MDDYDRIEGIEVFDEVEKKVLWDEVEYKWCFFVKFFLIIVICLIGVVV